MKRNLPYYPVQTSVRDERSAEIFSNAVAGGPSFREEVALRVYTALLSNPAYIGTRFSVEALRAIAWDQADKFIADSETGSPSKNPVVGDGAKASRLTDSAKIIT